jgi:hypothetical protein
MGQNLANFQICIQFGKFKALDSHSWNAHLIGQPCVAIPVFVGCDQHFYGRYIENCDAGGMIPSSNCVMQKSTVLLWVSRHPICATHCDHSQACTQVTLKEQPHKTVWVGTKRVLFTSLIQMGYGRDLPLDLSGHMLVSCGLSETIFKLGCLCASTLHPKPPYTFCLCIHYMEILKCLSTMTKQHRVTIEAGTCQYFKKLACFLTQPSYPSIRVTGGAPI